MAEGGLQLLRPALLALALVALPLVLIALLGRAARRRERVRLVAPRHAERFLPGHSDGRGLVRALLAGLALVLLGLSLSGPVRGWTVRNVSRRGLDLVVCIDTSRSMLVRDIRPDRLARALREVGGLIDRLRGDRVALIAFSGDAREVAPLTHDRTTLKELLARVTPDDNLVGGTDLGAALGAALAMFDGRTGAHEAVVLLTDGEDLAGSGYELAESAAERGIRVYVVGMGTEQGGKIPVLDREGRERFLADEQGAEVVSALSGASLEELARVTGGEYLAAARSAAPLEELYQMRISRLEGRNIDGTEWVPHDRYQWALVLALACMLLESGLRERVRTRLASALLLLPLGGGPQLTALAQHSTAGEHAAALEVAAALLAAPAFEAAPENERAEIRYALGVARYRAEARAEAAQDFLAARDLAGPGELRLEAAYNLAALLLEQAEQARLLIPEIGGGAPGAPAALPGPPVPGAEEEGPDPLDLAAAAFRAARAAHLDRVRLGTPDEDTRANLELIGRRLRELEEIRRQREEQQQEQDPQQEQSSEPQEGDESEPQDSEDQQSEEQQDSESEPQQPPEDQRSEQEQEPQDSQEPEEQPESEEPSSSEDEQQDGSEEQQAEPTPAEPMEERLMSREELQRLLDQLAEIEEEALRVQQALTQKRRVPVEKDW